MASRALHSFLKNIDDVRALIEIAEITDPTRGHPVLNKTGIVLTCAYWEAFCEDIASEALDHLIQHMEDFTNLPVKLWRDLATQLIEDKNDLAVWNLAGHGWRDELRNRSAKFTAARNFSFNTPKPDQVDELFAHTIGIVAMSDCWTPSVPSCKTNGPLLASESRTLLRDFVAVRGAIAHRGKPDQILLLAHVRKYADLVGGLAMKTNDRIETAARSATGVQI